MAEQSNSERELRDERDAAVGNGVGGADTSGTGNILASTQRESDDNGESKGPASGAGEDEGSTSSRK